MGMEAAGLSELLQNPIAGRMCGGVEMENAALMMLDDEEAVQHTETQRGHGEQVEGGDPPIRVAAVPRGCEAHPRMNSQTSRVESTAESRG